MKTIDLIEVIATKNNDYKNEKDVRNMLTRSPLFNCESSVGKKRAEDPVGFVQAACKIRAYKERRGIIFDFIKKLPAFHYTKQPNILLNNTQNFDP